MLPSLTNIAIFIIFTTKIITFTIIMLVELYYNKEYKKDIDKYKKV